MTSPTQRSLKHLRDNGWHPEKVEWWNSFTHRRNDLFGFADLLAIKEGETPLLIQITTGSNLAARRTKVYENPLSPLVLKSGFRILLHGWAKYKVKRGGKATAWRLREEEVFSQ